MEFFANELYHIYNRGNNKQRIFFRPENYSYFLRKVTTHIIPFCNMIAYCLMPNHFHFLIHADQRTPIKMKAGATERNVLSEGIRNLLSGYTIGINRQNNSTGSLFQQNTRASAVVQGTEDYGLTCFHYIHQNPVKARLVTKLEDWPYSSFNDYCEVGKDGICSKQLAVQLLNLNLETFYQDSYEMLDSPSIDITLLKRIGRTHRAITKDVAPITDATSL